MNRRQFLVTTGLSFCLVVTKTLNAEAIVVDYTPGLIQKKLDAGETVLVDYAAEWCSTCKRQERVIEALRANNLEYDNNISFVRVDWDTYKSHDITKRYKVPRRSTLLLLRGDDELGRIVAGTNAAKIKDLMDLGLVDS